MNWISTVTGVVFGGWNTRLRWRFSGFLSSASLFLMRRTLVRDGMAVVTACSAFTMTCEVVHTTVGRSGSLTRDVHSAAEVYSASSRYSSTLTSIRFTLLTEPSARR